MARPKKIYNPRSHMHDLNFRDHVRDRLRAERKKMDEQNKNNLRALPTPKIATDKTYKKLRTGNFKRFSKKDCELISYIAEKGVTLKVIAMYFGWTKLNYEKEEKVVKAYNKGFASGVIKMASAAFYLGIEKNIPKAIQFWLESRADWKPFSREDITMTAEDYEIKDTIEFLVKDDKLQNQALKLGEKIAKELSKKKKS